MIDKVFLTLSEQIESNVCLAFKLSQAVRRVLFRSIANSVYSLHWILPPSLPSSKFTGLKVHLGSLDEIPPVCVTVFLWPCFRIRPQMNWNKSPGARRSKVDVSTLVEPRTGETMHWQNHALMSLHWLTIFTVLTKSPDTLSLSLGYVNELGRIITAIFP